MGDRTYSKTKLGCSIPHNKHIQTKMISILLAILLVSTVFSSLSFAKESNDDSSEENNIVASILGDVKEKISSASSKLGSRLRDFINQIQENRKGLLSLRLVTRYQKDDSSEIIEKSTRMKLLLPTSIDIDGDRDKDIRVWVFRRPALDLRPPAICWKTTLLIRRLPGMSKEMIDDFLEVYLEYKPRLFSILEADADRIRIGYQSPMGEEIPKTCIVTHKNIPHFLYPRKKTTHRIGINPISIIGKEQLNLLFSVIDMVDGEVSSELLMQVNHSPAVKNEISFERSKDRFIRRGQTLEITRKIIGGSSNVTLFIKDRAKNDSFSGSLTINNVPKKISLSWFLGRNGYFEIDSHGSSVGAVKAAVDGAITLGFTPRTGLDAYFGWESPGLIGLLKGKGFYIETETHASAVLSDFYVKVPSFTLLAKLGLGLPVYKLDLTASLLSLNLDSGTSVGNLRIKPYPGVDYVRTEVENAELVLEDCVINMKPIEPPEKPTVSIISPEEGDTVKEIVTITGTANKAPEGKEIQFVEIQIDGRGEWFRAEGTTDWSYEWDSKTVSNGVHKITAKCFDGDNEGSDSIKVTVDNPGYNWYPTVTITSPSKLALVSGVVTIAGTADDENDPKSNLSVNLQIEDLLGKNVLGENVPVSDTGRWSYEWNTTDLTAGLYTIRAESYDGKDYSLSLVPVEVQVWVRLKCILDLNVSSASVDITNFAIHGESASLDVSSFNASGSGSLRVAEGAISAKASGSLKIQDFSVHMINETGNTTLSLDNLNADVYGYGMVLLSPAEIALELNASIYLDVDGLYIADIPKLGALNLGECIIAGEGLISAGVKVDDSSISIGGYGDREDVLLDVRDLLLYISDVKKNYLLIGADQIKMNGSGAISFSDDRLDVQGYLDEFVLDNFYINTTFMVVSLSGSFDFSKTASLALDVVDLLSFNLSYQGEGFIKIIDPRVEIRSPQFGTVGACADSIVIDKGGYAYLSYYKDDLNVSCHVKIDSISITDLTVWFNESTYYIGNISGSFEFWFYLYLDDLFIDSGLDWIKIIIRGNGKTHVEVHRAFNVSGIEGSIDAIVDFETGDGTFMIYLYNLSGSIGININGSAVVELTDFHLRYGDIIDLYVPKATGNLELVNISKESGLFMFTMEGGGGSSLDLDFSIELGDSDLGLYVVVDDAHIDLDGSSAFLKLMWNDSGITNFGFALDADVTLLTIDDVDVKLVIEGNDMLNLENLTVYHLVGYIGAYVDLVMPFDFVNDTFDINLGDLDVYLGIDDLSAAGTSLGKIEISANVTGNATISLLNISTETIYNLFGEPNLNLTWINLTIGIDATNGVDLNIFDIESVPLIGSVTIANLSITGYSKIDVGIGLLLGFPSYIRVRFDNSQDTSISFDNFSVAFPITEELLIPIRIYDGNLVKGVFDVLLRILPPVAVEVANGSAVDHLGVELEISGLEAGLYFDGPFDYLSFDLNMGLGFNENKEEYIFLDTRNTTATFDLYAIIPPEHINSVIDTLNEIFNLSIPYVENDFGIRINNVTLQADEFYLHNLSDPANWTLSGYLILSGEGNIWILINGTWYPLDILGLLAITVEPGHLRIYVDEKLTVDRIITLPDGTSITIKGIFTGNDSYLEAWWNRTTGFVKLEWDLNMSIEDFVLKIDDLVNISASAFRTAGAKGNFTLDISDKNGSLLLYLEDHDSMVDIDIEDINISNLFNVTLQCSADVYLERGTSGSLNISWNESGIISAGGDLDRYVNGFINITNLYFAFPYPRDPTKKAEISAELLSLILDGDLQGEAMISPGSLGTGNILIDVSNVNLVLENCVVNATLRDGKRVEAVVGTGSLLGNDSYLEVWWDNTTGNKTGFVELGCDLNISIEDFVLKVDDIAFISASALAIGGVKGNLTVNIDDKNGSLLLYLEEGDGRIDVNVDDININLSKIKLQGSIDVYLEAGASGSLNVSWGDSGIISADGDGYADGYLNITKLILNFSKSETPTSIKWTNVSADLISLVLDGNLNGTVKIQPNLYYGIADINVSNAHLLVENCKLSTDIQKIGVSPTVNITYPSEDQEVNGTITIKGYASDEDGWVEKVEVRIDDGNWQNATYNNETYRWYYVWNTTTVENGNGNHTITARAIDNEDYESNKPTVPVIVNNPGVKWRPNVSIISPTSGEKVSDIVWINLTASDPDDDPIEKVQVKIDQDWQNATYDPDTDMWIYEWNTSYIPYKGVTILARSYDGEYYSVIDSVGVTVINIDVNVFLRTRIFNASMVLKNVTVVRETGNISINGSFYLERDGWFSLVKDKMELEVEIGGTGIFNIVDLDLKSPSGELSADMISLQLVDEPEATAEIHLNKAFQLQSLEVNVSAGASLIIRNLLLKSGNNVHVEGDLTIIGSLGLDLALEKEEYFKFTISVAGYVIVKNAYVKLVGTENGTFELIIPNKLEIQDGMFEARKDTEISPILLFYKGSLAIEPGFSSWGYSCDLISNFIGLGINVKDVNLGIGIPLNFTFTLESLYFDVNVTSDTLFDEESQSEEGASDGELTVKLDPNLGRCELNTDSDYTSLSLTKLNFNGSKLKTRIESLNWNRLGDIDWIIDIGREGNSSDPSRYLRTEGNAGAFYFKLKHYINIGTSLAIKNFNISFSVQKERNIDIKWFNMSGQRQGYQYLELKNGSLNVTVDMEGSWNGNIEGSLDDTPFGLDFEGAISGNCTIHIKPGAGEQPHHIDVIIYEPGYLTLFGINHTGIIRPGSLEITLGAFELQPGKITIEVRNLSTVLNGGRGWVNIENQDVNATLGLLKIKKTLKRLIERSIEIKLVDVTLSPGETYFEWQRNIGNRSYLYIDNTAYLNITILEITWGTDFFRLGKAGGILEIVPGQFNFSYEPLTGDKYDHKLIIKNGIFGGNLLGLVTTLKIGELEISLSKRVRNINYDNTITIKLRNRGQKNRALYIDTSDFIEIDRFVITVTYDDVKLFELESLTSIKRKYEGFYIGFFDGKFDVGGKIRRFDFNLFEVMLSFRWRDDNDKYQEISLHGYKNQQIFGINLDATNCTDDITFNFPSLELGRYEITASSTLNAQSYLDFEMDLNLTPTPEEGDQGHFHIYVDTGGEYLAEFSFKIYREDTERGISITAQSIMANEFNLSGKSRKVGDYWLPILSSITWSGVIDVVNLVIKVKFANTGWITIWGWWHVVVNIEQESYETVAGQTLEFQASAYSGTPPYTYTWTFPDGVTSDLQNPTHTFMTPGTYTVTLSVTDKNGITGTATSTVQVADHLT